MATEPIFFPSPPICSYSSPFPAGEETADEDRGEELHVVGSGDLLLASEHKRTNQNYDFGSRLESSLNGEATET